MSGREKALPQGFKKGLQHMMDMRISTSGLRDSLPPPLEHHESQLFYQWAFTFLTQQQTQHGLPTTSMIDSQRDQSIEGGQVGRTKD